MEIEHEPHYRFPDWPGKTNIYFEQGVATLENILDGAHLFINVGAEQFANRACLTLEETEKLHEQLGFALEEQRRLVREYQELYSE
jgi:hypothetical protein